MVKKEENKKGSKKGSKTGSKKIAKPKKASKPKKIFCGITDPIPKDFRLGSMKECLDKGQVRYYGLKKIDNKILETVTKKKELETESTLQIKAAGFRGKLTKLKKDLDKTEDAAEKKRIKEEYEQIRQQLIVIGEKINKIKNKV